MKIYSTDSKFDFGKYEGCRLMEVHQGSLSIDLQLLKRYVINQLFGKEVINYIELFDLNVSFFDLYHEAIVTETSIEFFREKIEIIDNEIITENIGIKIADKALENYLNYCNSTNGAILGLTSLQKFANSIDFKGTLFGDPTYISWCIKEIDQFVLEPTTFQKLEKFRISKFSKFNVLQLSSGECQYSICSNTLQFVYSQKIKDANQKKLDSYVP